LSLVFFTDRDLGKQFPNILSEAGLSVEKHFDHFKDTTKDEEWLAEIGRRGWYAITHDQRIRYKPNEKAAVFEAGVGLFIVIGKAPFPQLAENFIATFPKIKQFVEKHPTPFIAKVYRPDGRTGELRQAQSGRVEMWESYKDVSS
jgi:PIN like domain